MLSCSSISPKNSRFDLCRRPTALRPPSFVCSFSDGPHEDSSNHYVTADRDSEGRLVGRPKTVGGWSTNTPSSKKGSTTSVHRRTLPMYARAPTANPAQVFGSEVAWESTTGLSNRGRVTFEDRGEDSCLMTLTLSYNLPYVSKNLSRHVGRVVRFWRVRQPAYIAHRCAMSVALSLDTVFIRESPKHQQSVCIQPVKEKKNIQAGGRFWRCSSVCCFLFCFLYTSVLVSFSCDVCVRRAVSCIVGSFGLFNVLPVQVIASVLRLEAVERFVKRTILR